MLPAALVFNPVGVDAVRSHCHPSAAVAEAFPLVGFATLVTTFPCRQATRDSAGSNTP